MTTKSALYLLAVVALTGSMAVAAFAEQRIDASGQETGFSPGLEQGMDQASSGEIREPIETGAVPEGAALSDPYKRDAGEEPAVDFGGQSYRPVDLGP